MTILDRLRLTAARHTLRTALHVGRQQFTFAALEGGSNAAARVLRSHGVRRGQRVCLYAGKSIDFVTAYLGALKLGAICVPANPAYRETELGWILCDSEPVVVVTDLVGCGVVRRSAPPTVRALLVVGDAPTTATGTGRGIPSFPFHQELRRSSSRPLDELVLDEDLALIVYTSGTTGRAKGAMIRHGNLVANIDALVAAFRWTEDDRLVHALPLFHVHGLCVGLHGTLATGAETVLLPRFDAQHVLDQLEQHRATLFLGVPTMYSRLLQTAGEKPPPLTAMRLFVSGSAPLPIHVAKRFEALFGHRLLERYGMTETLITFAQPYDGSRRFGTVGHPVQGIAARVVDGRMRDLQDGETGELLVRGSSVGPGYWRNEEATQAAFADGWFRTGDLARLARDDGLLSIVGRSRDLILSGGFNVYPREVEEALGAHPEVAEVAVFGLPDDDLGEAVAAAVVPVQGASPDVFRLLEFCRERLASYKKPRTIRLVDALPRNAMGKLLRERLRP